MNNKEEECFLFLAWSILQASCLIYMDWAISIPVILILILMVISANQNRETFLVSYVLISLAVTGLAFFVRYICREAYCWNFECCRGSWIPRNVSGLALVLNRRLYGQHLVNGPVVRHLRGHVEGHPHRPLVLSFHGPSGTGKNYAATMMAEHLYLLGMESQYVHFFSPTKDFISSDQVDAYKTLLKTTIETASTTCTQSMFIFDEIDKMPIGLIDVLKPYLDFHAKVDGNDYRSNIFVFLSNAGGDRLMSKTVDTITSAIDREDLEFKATEQPIIDDIFKEWDRTMSITVDTRASAIDREDLEFKDMEQLIIDSITESDPLKKSSLVESNLITAYIPFLALEKSHVKQCVIDSLLSKGYYGQHYQVDMSRVAKVLEELQFDMSFQRISITGCKRVKEKIDYIMQTE